MMHVDFDKLFGLTIISLLILYNLPEIKAH